MAGPGLFRQPRRGNPPRTTTIPLTVYGRPWCGISQMIRRYLDRMGIPYDYVDLDRDPNAEARLQWLSGGRLRTPMVQVGDQMLVQPTVQDVARALQRRGVTAAR
jgi:mycoredoxin